MKGYGFVMSSITFVLNRERRRETKKGDPVRIALGWPGMRLGI